MIAYLGWGSLIWDPRSLPIRGEWKKDGPLLPIEFARISKDQRLTLILVDDALTVPSLWCIADVSSFEEGQKKLAEREEIQDDNVKYSIGWWRSSDNESHGRSAQIIGAWGREKNFQAVFWTNLKCNFAGVIGRMPSYVESVTHLKSLSGEGMEKAREYVRRAPKQIMTNYRRGFEGDLGWTWQE